MTLDNNLKLAENTVLSVEESLSKVFQERSNQVFQKLENILTILRKKKFLLVISINLLVVDMMIYLEKKLMRFLQGCFSLKRQLLECNL